MPLLYTHSDDANSVQQEQVSVPPLFAGPLRDELSARIEAALSDGDHEKAAVLLHEADNTFPADPVFAPLRSRCVKLARRKAQFEAALQGALNELSEDRFAAAFGKFREALSLSRGYEMLARKFTAEAVAVAGKQVPRHWRFAEALLHEVSAAAGSKAGSSALWAALEAQKREECVRVALDESGRAEHTAYLPHLRDRLADLTERYPNAEPLDARLRVLDKLLEQRVSEERDKNLRRMALFRDRLDLTAKPETLRGFAELVAPFAAPYSDDPDFAAIKSEVRDLRSKYDSAESLLAENRLQDSMLICDQVLQHRPKNVLFCALEEKAKSREWIVRRISSTTQRARAFEEKAQYAEALEEWEALREIDPRQPGLASEILHCAALKYQSESIRTFQPAPMDETALTPEIVGLIPEPEVMMEREPEPEPAPAQSQALVPVEPPPFYEEPAETAAPTPARARFRIVITAGAWNNLKTGLAAALAVLLVIIVFASGGSR